MLHLIGPLSGVFRTGRKRGAGSAEEPEEKQPHTGLPMQQVPNATLQVFEVSLYNEEVRTQARDNRCHQFFDARWADVQVRDVVARDAGEARRLISERFPPDDGFVITDVTPTTF